LDFIIRFDILNQISWLFFLVGAVLLIVIIMLLD
jgi:hypothetical protein